MPKKRQLNDAALNEIRRQLTNHPLTSCIAMREILVNGHLIRSARVTDKVLGSTMSRLRRELGLPSARGRQLSSEKLANLLPQTAFPPAPAAKPAKQRRVVRPVPVEAGEDLHFCPRCGMNLRMLQQLMRIARQTQDMREEPDNA